MKKAESLAVRPDKGSITLSEEAISSVVITIKESIQGDLKSNVVTRFKCLIGIENFDEILNFNSRKIFGTFFYGDRLHSSVEIVAYKL